MTFLQVSSFVLPISLLNAFSTAFSNLEMQNFVSNPYFISGFLSKSLLVNQSKSIWLQITVTSSSLIDIVTRLRSVANFDFYQPNFITFSGTVSYHFSYRWSFY